MSVPLRDVPRRFAVAFSLAGEQRQFVMAVAEEVEAILGRSTVFYDGWFEHWIAGSDADLMLQRLYAEGSDLVVYCISGDYGRKSWTQAEYRAIRATFLKDDFRAKRQRLLPIRVGDGDVEGVLANEIVPDFRTKLPNEAAEFIVARLNQVRVVPESPEPELRWPDAPPTLQWPVADHSKARDAFANLLTAGSPTRVLLIQGPSDAGKTHMSRQMLRNVTVLPGIACGRLDFKGTTDISVEIEAFATPLDVVPPDGRTVSESLGKIFTDLRRQNRPTVIVLDTYEAAGDAVNWIEGVLLPQVVAAPWLRVVVTGQSVPNRIGTTWESLAARTIALHPPEPHDWLQFGHESGASGIDLQFVKDAHRLAEGKSSVLAALFRIKA